MMLGRLMVFLVSVALVLVGLGIALDQPYVAAKSVTGFAAVLLGGLLFTRLVQVAQRNERRN